MGTVDDDSDPSTACVRCGSGYFSPLGATACIGCAHGRADIDLDASTACESCGAGSVLRLECDIVH